jgi:hypothetical protein
MFEIKNVLTPLEINELIDYQNILDHRSDIRPDVASKHPRWDVDQWPQHVVKKVLDAVLDYNYQVDEVIFNLFKISFKLHVDSGDTKEQSSGHGIIIPLYTKGESYTVFFNNFWNEHSAKFSKKENSPFEYQLPNKKEEFQTIKDIREFYKQCIDSPESILDFNVDIKLIKELEYLIEARSNKKIGKVDNRCYDYSQIINYDNSKLFDQTVHQKYLNHIDIESLHGLSVSNIVEWIPGNIIVFERNRLHAGAGTHKEKSGITVFTKRY